VRCHGRNGSSVIIEIKRRGITPELGTDFVRTPEGDFSLGKEGQELAAYGGNLHDAVCFNREGLGCGQSGAHPLEERERIGIDGGCFFGAEGAAEKKSHQGEEERMFHEKDGWNWWCFVMLMLQNGAGDKTI
jgi:hypothetical protein